jgi:hypothetical protein
MLRRGADGFKKLANSMDAAENFDDQTMAKKHVIVIQRGIFRTNFTFYKSGKIGFDRTPDNPLKSLILLSLPGR